MGHKQEMALLAGKGTVLNSAKLQIPILTFVIAINNQSLWNNLQSVFIPKLLSLCSRVSAQVFFVCMNQSKSDAISVLQVQSV